MRLSAKIIIFLVCVALLSVILIMQFHRVNDGLMMAEIEIPISRNREGTLIVVMQIPESYSLSIDREHGWRIYNPENVSIAQSGVSVLTYGNESIVGFRDGVFLEQADAINYKYIGDMHVIYGILYQGWGGGTTNYVYWFNLEGFRFSIHTWTFDPEDLTNIHIVENIIYTLEVIAFNE